MKRMFILIVISLISISSASSFADATQENITLSRISNILNAVYPLIYKAQKESDKNTRIKFQYAWLKKDIKKIQSGIAQKINEKEIEPRVVAPLNTKYIEQQNSNE